MNRWLPFLILLAFLVCYLEWSGGNSGFIFKMEYDLFSKDFKPANFFHPMILLPLAGQLCLLFSLFYQNRKLIIAAIILLSVLVLMIFLVGILSLNFKIIASTLPFLGLAIYYLFRSRK
jgi:hypothetical protein